MNVIGVSGVEMNRFLMILIAIGSFCSCSIAKAEPTYRDEITKWRETVEKNLRADNGWLTLAGRFPLKDGPNTFGTDKENDVVLPSQLKGAVPGRLGTLVVDQKAGKVTLKLADGIAMSSQGKPFKGDRDMVIATDKRDWVTYGRISMHIIERSGRYILRLADNESLVRKNFPGRIWYDVNEKFKVEAKFVAYPVGKTLPIVNVIDEVTKMPCPGYLEFKIDGVTHKIDALAEGEGLFIIIRDETSGDTTYPPSRFMMIEKAPKANETITLDFNKAYNPPCAFSEFTTCPLPPPQNILKVKIEAGEKYRKK